MTENDKEALIYMDSVVAPDELHETSRLIQRLAHTWQPASLITCYCGFQAFNRLQAQSEDVSSIDSEMWRLLHGIFTV